MSKTNGKNIIRVIYNIFKVVVCGIYGFFFIVILAEFDPFASRFAGMGMAAYFLAAFSFFVFVVTGAVIWFLGKQIPDWKKFVLTILVGCSVTFITALLPMFFP